MQKIIVGISGGIDSAVTVLLLKEQGHEVNAVHLILYDAQLKSISELNKLCDILKVPVDFIDLRKRFNNEIVDFYINERLQGRTPSPCVNCNQFIKWEALLNYANEHGTEKIATGHYIQIKELHNKRRLFKAKDLAKDQSYYLWGVKEDFLNRAVTPLGNYLKSEIRDIATKNQLGFLAKKKESAGLCFAQNIVNETYLNKVLRSKNISPKKGLVYDSNKNIIGKHQGLVYYTVGQKKGMELKINYKPCVKIMSPDDNSIITDTWQNLYTNKFTATDFYFFDRKELEKLETIAVNVRGFGLNPKPGLRNMNFENNTTQIELNDRAWAPAPGQPVVFYKDDLILGGAIISEVF